MNDAWLIGYVVALIVGIRLGLWATEEDRG
jgi:hypothetical protein